jgi:hypothetical protein
VAEARKGSECDIALALLFSPWNMIVRWQDLALSTMHLKSMRRLAESAAKDASRKAPIKYSVVGVQGDILQEKWL